MTTLGRPVTPKVVNHTQGRERLEKNEGDLDMGVLSLAEMAESRSMDAILGLDNKSSRTASPANPARNSGNVSVPGSAKGGRRSPAPRHSSGRGGGVSGGGDGTRAGNRAAAAGRRAQPGVASNQPGQLVSVEEFEAKLSAAELKRYTNPSMSHGFSVCPPSKVIRAKSGKNSNKSPVIAKGRRANQPKKNSAALDMGGLSVGGTGMSIGGKGLF